MGLEMLRAGMATIYESKMGAEFGKLEAKYRAAEDQARVRRIGIWAMTKKQFISPGAYKKALREREREKPGGK